MAGALIALIVVVLLARMLPPRWCTGARYAGVYDYWRALARLARYDTRADWPLLLAIGVPMLATGVLAQQLDARAPALLGMAFDVAVLLYAWGPRDLEHDVHEVSAAGSAAARREAAAHLFELHQPVPVDAGSLVEAVFMAGLRRWFAVALWFVLLGPAGALGYRLLALCASAGARDGVPAAWVPVATRLRAVADWPAAQLLALAIALASDFKAVREAWRNAGGAAWAAELAPLRAAARAGVRTELASAAEDDALDALDGSAPPPVPPLPGAIPELADALSLAWRCLLGGLAVLALLVIAGWAS